MKQRDERWKCYLRARVAHPIYAWVQLKGEDARSFLQTQLTIDVTRLVPGALDWWVTCSPEGRVQSLGRLYCHAEGEFYSLVDRSVQESVCADLRRYGRFSKVAIQALDVPPFHYQATLGLAPRIYEDRVWWNEEGAFPEYSEEPLTAWFYGCILAHLPRVTASNEGRCLPHHLGLKDWGALCFTKGCYRGQEVIARMESREKVRRGLRHGILEEMLLEKQLDESTFKTQHAALGEVTYAGERWVLFEEPFRSVEIGGACPNIDSR